MLGRDKGIKLQFSALASLISENIKNEMAAVFEDFNSRGTLQSGGAAYAGAKKGIDILNSNLMDRLETIVQNDLNKRQWRSLRDLNKEFIDQQKKAIVNECIAQTDHQVGPYVEELVQRINSELNLFFESNQNRQKMEKKRRLFGKVWELIRPILTYLLVLGLGYLLGKYY